MLLDGELIFSASVPFPRHVVEPLAQCSIGWNLYGQTSGILLLSGAADLKNIRSMLNRLAGRVDDVNEDPDVFGSCPPDLDLWNDSAPISAQQRLKRRLLGSKYRFFAALLPNRTIDGLCLEPHNGNHARLSGDTTNVWITSTLQDVVRSIGGTPTLLSLAHELLSDPPRLWTSKEIISPFTGRNVDTVLSVLLCFLDGNLANQVRSPGTTLRAHPTN